jgi:hypothetical protein
MKLGRALLVLTALVALVAPVLAGESGPKIGWAVHKFEVQDITGPNKGKTLCYV